MSAPKGNKNAIGNKGGRRPAEKEMQWHKEIWVNETPVRDLEKKISSGKYSVRDVYLLKALKADTAILRNLADKVLATLVDHTTDGEKLSSSVLMYPSQKDVKFGD